jgi:hypothetical protein
LNREKEECVSHSVCGKNPNDIKKTDNAVSPKFYFNLNYRASQIF